MKRSEINSLITWAKALLAENKVFLPRHAYWEMDEWHSRKGDIGVLSKVMLGWDVSDFGSGTFPRWGCVLYTIRNGLPDGTGTPYAEKLLLFREGQAIPMHYHAVKTEDIINRGGGMLSVRFYHAKADGSVDHNAPVEYYSDGLAHTAAAGEEILIAPGNSVRITPRLYHILGAKEDAGALVAGEVSSINDDKADNFFAEPADRFMTIEEDVPPLCPLCNEYSRLL